jgi:hypothetical protein
MPELESLAVKPKLSNLVIDTNKDWASYVIKNLGAPVDPNDSIRKTDLDSHRTASPLDHTDGSVTTDKLANLSVTPLKLNGAVWGLILAGL